MPPRENYIGAMGNSSRLDLYDPLVRLAVRERRFKRRLLAEARLRPGFRVLDLGCGTGTLTVMAKRAEPQTTIVGVDGDPAAIEFARKKVEREELPIAIHLAFAQQLPYPDHAFDRVFSTLVIHHLSHEGKIAAIGEIARILAPAGELHLADFGLPANRLMNAGFFLVRKFDGMEATEDNVRGHLPDMIAHAGFQNVRETARYSTIFGTIRLYAACAPA
jgi:ubiquinone/menaquinone biosynthesis C-methylase UbiE